MGTGSPQLPSWSSDPVRTCRRPAWEGTGFEGTVGFLTLLQGMCMMCPGGTHRPWLPSICPRMRYRALNKKRRAQRREFHPLHVFSLVLVRAGLHLSHIFFTLDTCTDDEACSLSFHCEGCLCELLGLGFSCFISSHMIAGSGSLCIYGWFFAGILRNVPTFELACSETSPREPLVRKIIAFSTVLCCPWGSAPFTGAVLPGLFPSHWQHFWKLKKAYLSPCSFICRQANAVSI